jgi:hypothetical protein
MAGFANQIGDRPVLLALLEMLEGQLDNFVSSQSTCEEDG